MAMEAWGHILFSYIRWSPWGLGGLIPSWQDRIWCHSRDGEIPMLEKLPDSIGEALRGKRAGLAHIVFHRLSNPFDLPNIKIRSSAFGAETPIPIKYTADG